MSNDREQKLVSLAFEIGLRCASDPALSAGSSYPEPRVAAWISAFLEENGFPTRPTGMSWGVLIRTGVTSPVDDADTYTPLASLEGFLRAATRFVHKANKKWWVDIHTGQPIQRNVGELLMLIVSELAEGMEGHRKSLMDDKLPKRPMLEVELADALIRILDMAEGLGLDLAGAFRDKMEFNAKRADHMLEARKQPNGKKY